MTKSNALAIAALLGGFVLSSVQPADSASITVELGECNMFSPDFTECLEGVAYPDVDLTDEPLWIDFTLFGTPGAHIVAREDALWSITIGTTPEFSAPFPLLTLTDMDGVISGFADIAPSACDPLGVGAAAATLCTYDVLLPADTYVHDLHFESFAGMSISPGFIFVDTHGIEHEKGLWVPEPATATLIALGLVGLARRRRSNHTLNRGTCAPRSRR